MKILKKIKDILTNPYYSRWICPLLYIGDAFLCAAIILKVPYTEIDWTAYMEQVELYINGETDYTYLKGATGPLVYPGLHVYVYRVLYAFTNKGQNIIFAQAIFMVLYLISLAIVMKCYQIAKAPPYIYPLLILSKRLHSIYLLRLFNDCFTVLFLYVAILLYQKKHFYIGTAFYTCGLGIKMNLLLVLPGLAFVILQSLGTDKSLTQALIVIQFQGIFAYEFVKTNWRSYLYRAFQLNRQFLYKWTVNWRFVPEEIFLSTSFSLALLSLHASLLLLFAATRWTKPTRRSLLHTAKLYLTSSNADEIEAIAERITPEFAMTTILTANSIGMLCARSLHYQFFSWTAWATPFLLWRAKFHPVFIYMVWVAQEWAWNVYPSTSLSSEVAVGCLAITIYGVWWGTNVERSLNKHEKDD